ncbi:FUSC family protein [Lampropedia puyangensis]|uniref:FUSC family protein n=1 Tax=Lampropedia puyangensis TaxID=1330072 RepID=A0A4S8F054_9BURK|nr:FUSC family protein [Lampropedia puyangensis]THT98471.1 FUSC family protein [Lampropedia puyangensis]
MTQEKSNHVTLFRALQQVASPARLTESLVLQRPASLHNALLAGLQAAITVVLAAGALHLCAWSHLAAYGGLGALAALYGRTAPSHQRHRVVMTAGLLLVLPIWLLSMIGLAPLSTTSMLLTFALISGCLAALVHRAQLGLPGVVIFIFAASAALTPASDWSDAMARAGAAAFGVVSAIAVCWTTEHWRQSLPHTTTAQGSLPATPRYSIRAFLAVSLCTWIAAMIAQAAGLAHPAWASIGAVAVIQGAHLPSTVHRGWQRTLGTIVGAGIAWAILALHPNFWGLLAAVALLQILTELFMGYNYGLGQMAVTPMALLMTALASNTGAADMAIARIYDTVLGAVVGVGLALLLSTLEERVFLEKHHLRL